MKKNSIKFILVIFTIFFVNCSAKKINHNHEDNKAYNYIEIAECFIPISKKYEFIEQDTKYEYSYFKINHDFKNMILKSNSYISFFSKDKYSYKDVMDSFDRSNNKSFISETKKRNFIIIENSLSFDPDSKNFELIGDKSTIQLLNTSKKEVDYIINYCDKTRK